MDDRLPTELWVAAQIRQCQSRNIPVYVTRRGNAGSGMVMLKVVVAGKGCRLLSQARDMDGAMGWMDAFDGETVEERRADDYAARAAARDPDLWIIEAEDASGGLPFEGKVF